MCASAVDLPGASYVTLGILDRSDRRWTDSVTCGADGEDWIKRGDAAPGILHTVVAARRPLRGHNAGGSPATLGLPSLHPTIEAFLTVPIASPAHVYGWICLVCNEGRTFTSDDEQLILALSGQVGRIYENGYFYAVAQRRAAELELQILEREQVELALRRERDRANTTLDALRTAEERMRFALESADVGIWDMNYATGVLQWSPTLEAQHGLEPGTFSGRFADFLELVHPDDRTTVAETIDGATKSGTDFSIRNRAVWPDGTVRWLEGAGRIVLHEHGEPLRRRHLPRRHRTTRLEEYHQAQKMEAIGRSRAPWRTTSTTCSPSSSATAKCSSLIPTPAIRGCRTSSRFRRPARAPRR